MGSTDNALGSTDGGATPSTLGAASEVAFRRTTSSGSWISGREASVWAGVWMDGCAVGLASDTASERGGVVGLGLASDTVSEGGGTVGLGSDEGGAVGLGAGSESDGAVGLGSDEGGVVGEGSDSEKDGVTGSGSVTRAGSVTGSGSVPGSGSGNDGAMGSTESAAGSIAGGATPSTLGGATDGSTVRWTASELDEASVLDNAEGGCAGSASSAWVSGAWASSVAACR